ncbi:MAG TPA: HD domain-containing phosphohydrolase [Gaiellales bacterium]|jgi:HD-GYP domain-containing protein (c-di-GMP phosphodiesterase class II)/putative methionine-R-sulfoxide reductase with GAF domain|nr:HD domain-containing phosphohydrolase [Gaiellales bacterium]
MPHRSRVTAVPADASDASLDLVATLAELSSKRERGALLEAGCAAFGRLLALDAVAAVKLTETGIACEGRWARPGARPNRVGEARMAAAVELCDGHGSGVTQGAFGRLQLVAMPIVSDGAVRHVIAATAHPGRQLSEADQACAATLAVHLASCLDMVAAVSAAREYMLLERAIAPEQSRGDRALEQMQLVRSLAGAFMGVRSLPEVGRIVVGQLHTLIDYHSCRFYVVSQDGDLLLPAALMGVGEVYAGEDVEDLVVAVGEGITGRVFETGKPLRVDDASAVPFSVEIPGTEPIDESMLVAPMVSEHGSVGVIVLSKEGLARFDDDDLRLLEVIAAHAAIACENVRLIAGQQEAADISEALLELGAALSLQENVEGIASMLAIAIDRLVECAGISIWARDSDVLVPVNTVGYTPREAHRLMRARLRVTDQPLAAALSGRGIASLDLDQTPALTGCLDAAPAGTTYAVIAIGERSHNRGAVIVQRGPRRGPISPRDQRMLLGIADQALLAITNRSLYDELDRSFLATMQALGNALDAKDAYTNDHAQALVGLCTAVADRLGVAGSELRDISVAAALHDIGKIGIPADILNKPGPLTASEWAVMKTHPQLGAQILEPVRALAGAAELVISCHEHWDGSGYPNGLAGPEIPLGARVILACDAYDAITTDRVYRKARPSQDAVQELRRCSGRDFDPQVVDVLAAVIAATS